MEIRKVQKREVAALQVIAEQTFLEAYATGNNNAAIEAYVKRTFTIQNLEVQLQTKNSEFYFAIAKEKVLGYLKVNTGKAQTHGYRENALQIERIYVLREYYGKKVGQYLYQKAMDLAKEKGVEHIWLSVWEENHRAIRFYTKNGCIAHDKLLFKVGKEEQIDIVMKCKIHNP